MVSTSAYWPSVCACPVVIICTPVPLWVNWKVTVSLPWVLLTSCVNLSFRKIVRVVFSLTRIGVLYQAYLLLLPAVSTYGTCQRWSPFLVTIPCCSLVVVRKVTHGATRQVLLQTAWLWKPLSRH